MYKYIQKYQCQPSELIDVELCLQRFAVWGQILSFIVRENPDRIPRTDFLCFIPLFSFCYLLSLFSHHLIFHFCLCVCDSGGWVFYRFGMTSMTEMACATSPSSAFAAAAFGASSSSVRLRYQTVGPLYVCQAGWATLPHSYYALDYCSPK